MIVSAGHVYFLLHLTEKKGDTIQYGYRKLGTHAQVFSQTLLHGNSKNEIDEETEKGTKRGLSIVHATTFYTTPDKLYINNMSS